MKVSIAQMNPTIGDISGNIQKLISTIFKCADRGSDLVVFPELFLTGYPPRDLLERPSFIDRVEEEIEEIKQISSRYPGLGIIFGAPVPTKKDMGKGLYNSAFLIHNGKILLQQNKMLLPTYDVFDEARYFDSAPMQHTINFKNRCIGITICEDAWNVPELWRKRPYEVDPIQILAEQGANCFINISASPFHVEKDITRFKIIKNHAVKHKSPFLFVNQVGGNDELIFDGRSIVVDEAGRPLKAFPAFEETVMSVDLNDPPQIKDYQSLDRIESIHDALIMGIRDYLEKCGFLRAVLGLSGGIDSAVACVLACKALGRENLLGVTMPGPFSSNSSVGDAENLAKNLGIAFKTIPITPIFNSYLSSMNPHFKDRQPDITEENIQARIRGNILMALSNKFGYLLLSTGNKSEMAVGYCTLYGDMSGGLSVISDVPKTMVYELADYINTDREIIPLNTIQKPPSAELAPDQIDQDTLPPYPILDDILRLYVDERQHYKQIVEQGHNIDTVRWVIRMVDKNEYKRKQSAPGLKVTSKAFGMGRRMPIAARHEHHIK